jgi:hypothetical protein
LRSATLSASLQKTVQATPSSSSSATPTNRVSSVIRSLPRRLGRGRDPRPRRSRAPADPSGSLCAASATADLGHDAFKAGSLRASRRRGHCEWCEPERAARSSPDRPHDAMGARSQRSEGGETPRPSMKPG